LKGWLLVKKFFALLLCFGLLSSMSLGIVGCDKGKTEAEKKAEKDKIEKDAKDKAEKEAKEKAEKEKK
jgi:hypothetical protein